MHNSFYFNWNLAWFLNNLLFVFVFVLMGWSLLPNSLRPFQIYCAPPNLGITRTWIRRLNFVQRPIFSGLRIFNEPEISDSGPPQVKVPPVGLLLRIFTSWKNPSTSARFEPANLGSRGEHVTPRPPRPILNNLNSITYSILSFLVHLWERSWIVFQILSVTADCLSEYV